MRWKARFWGSSRRKNCLAARKRFLLMANDPEKVFNASTCGDNCAPFILKLAKKKDLTINLRHLMDFGKKKFPVDVKVLNTGDVVHSMEELMPIAFQFV